MTLKPFLLFSMTQVSKLRFTIKRQNEEIPKLCQPQELNLIQLRHNHIK